MLLLGSEPAFQGIFSVSIIKIRVIHNCSLYLFNKLMLLPIGAIYRKRNESSYVVTLLINLSPGVLVVSDSVFLLACPSLCHLGIFMFLYCSVIIWCSDSLLWSIAIFPLCLYCLDAIGHESFESCRNLSSKFRSCHFAMTDTILLC
jgi:hypothetical protein